MTPWNARDRRVVIQAVAGFLPAILSSRMLWRCSSWLAVVAVCLQLMACGGDDNPSSPATPRPTQTLTALPSQTSTSTAAPTPTSTKRPSATASLPPSPSFTATQAPSATATAVPASPTPTLGPPLAEVGDVFRVRFSARPAPELSLWRGDTALLRLPADALQLGRVDQIDDAFNYDPYLLYASNPLFQPPAGLRWLSVVSADITASYPQSIVVKLVYEEGRQAVLRIEPAADGRFKVQLQPAAEGAPIAYFRLRPRVDSGEGFYGLGEYFDDVNHRGKLRAMQIEFDADLESSYNEAHVPVPFLIGTRGWGLFVETYYPGVFDVARQAADVVEAAFGTGAASSQGLTFHLFAADQPLDLTKHYYDVTGYPRLPATWALGPWIWRDENRDQAQFENDLNSIRDLDLATTAVWIDRPYASGVNTFDFKPSQFPDPDRMIALAHRLGLRMALWHTPYLDRSDASTKELRDVATQEGYYPLRSSLLFNGWGRPLDFTNPDAFAWWQGLIRRYTDNGIEGFKLDYGEDVAVGLSSARNVWRFADGSDERTMHAKYQLFYHRVYAQTLPDSGGFLLCRHGTWGDQTNGPIIWPGDLDANFAKHREVVSDGDKSYVAVGGLPASMIAGIGLGPSGFPFYGSDTGGYRHSPPDKELFTRWFEQTALSSVMQIGTSTNDVAWEPTPENGFDAEMLEWYRTYTRLHLRLFPYVWTYAQRIAHDGRPIQRPLGLAYPELGEHPWDEYMLGDDLLVAPVVERGQRRRQVIFPPGQWVDWWTGEAIGGRQMIDAPLDKLPLFQREGSIVPLLRPTIDAIAPTEDAERVDSYATTPGVLYARVVPGQLSTFGLFDGTVLTQHHPRLGAPIEVYLLKYEPGSEFRLGALFTVVLQVPIAADVVVSDNEAAAVRVDRLSDLDSVESGWFVDGATLHIKVGSGSHDIRVQWSLSP